MSPHPQLFEFTSKLTELNLANHAAAITGQQLEWCLSTDTDTYSRYADRLGELLKMSRDLTAEVIAMYLDALTTTQRQKASDDNANSDNSGV
jgi:hypothetical protein